MRSYVVVRTDICACACACVRVRAAVHAPLVRCAGVTANIPRAPNGNSAYPSGPVQFSGGRAAFPPAGGRGNDSGSWVGVWLEFGWSSVGVWLEFAIWRAGRCRRVLNRRTLRILFGARPALGLAPPGITDEGKSNRGSEMPPPLRYACLDEGNAAERSPARYDTRALYTSNAGPAPGMRCCVPPWKRGMAGLRLAARGCEARAWGSGIGSCARHLGVSRRGVLWEYLMIHDNYTLL